MFKYTSSTVILNGPYSEEITAVLFRRKATATAQNGLPSRFWIRGLTNKFAPTVWHNRTKLIRDET